MKSTAKVGVACGILVALLVVATGARASDENQSFYTISTARENIFSMAPAENPLQNWRGDWNDPTYNRREQETRRDKLICFPPDPPPLGAQMNFGAHAGMSTLHLSELKSHTGEMFYPPLSTCLTEFPDSAYRRFHPRVESYTREREALLAELRAALSGLTGAVAEERLATLTALAQRQDPVLTRLEADADELRNDTSDVANWYDRREWKLGRGPLHDRRPEQAVLEYQVVRAAAFYQDGLAPAQRRLLREAAMLMQDELSSEAADATAGIAPPTLMFFSPDLARILPVEDGSPAVRTMLAEFAAEKDALRRAVDDAVLEIDRAVLKSTRTRACETLAREQGPRLAALEQRADAIRREYAPTFALNRSPSPLELPPDLARMIADYEEGKRQFLAGLEEQQRALHEQLSKPDVGETVTRTWVPGRGWVYAALEELKKSYPQQHAAELARLTKLVGEIYPRLVAAAGPDRVAPMQAGSDTFLVTFMEEYQRGHAYFEYEIAVWEPGLSPAQRRLLFNGAMAQLELPMLRPERQPIKLPATLLASQGP
jgi:hypothetical protein